MALQMASPVGYYVLRSTDTSGATLEYLDLPIGTSVAELSRLVEAAYVAGAYRVELLLVTQTGIRPTPLPRD